MRLRRFAVHLRTRDWFAVFIDFVVVVLGILVGLQVNTWNEARKNRIEEREFFERLHRDLEIASERSARVRQRRLDLLQAALRAAEKVFGRAEGELGGDCAAIGALHFYNINLSSLTSFSELAASGRLSIIRDEILRERLLELQQIYTATSDLIAIQSVTAHMLPYEFPDLIQETAQLDPKLREVQSSYVCDLPAMRKNQKFLNAFSQNLDRYDAYIRDGLAPWSAALTAIHEQVHSLVGAKHQHATHAQPSDG